MSNIIKQPPLQTINPSWSNPLIHRPPSGLEETLSLSSENINQDPFRVTVQQKNQTPFKPVSSVNTMEDEDNGYGQYVEMGGKKKRKTRKTRRTKRKTHARKSKKSRKSKKNRKSKRMYRKH